MGALIDRILSEFTPGAVGIWVVAAMIAVWFVREYRETRKMSLEDRLARRDGYARQVERLMDENRLLRTEMHQNNEHHEAYRKQCHAETDQLRRMVVNLEGEVEAMKRVRAQDAIELARLKGIDSI